MRTLRNTLAAAMAAVLIGGGLLQAQPSADDAPAEQDAQEEVALAAGAESGAETETETAAESEAAAEAETAAEAAAEAETEAEAAAALSPQDMQAAAGRLLEEMQDVRTRVIAVRDEARKKKDVIRLDCVEDKLRQIEQLILIATAARDALAAVAGDDGDARAERQHQHSQITIAHEKTSALRDEADTCVGEEIVFPGATDVDMDAPSVADDPTQEPPFDLPGNPPIERPDPATPFL